MAGDIGRLPGNTGGKLVVTRLPDGTDFVAVGVQADPEPAIYGRDRWLSYHWIEDAMQWAGYFRRNLVHFIALFEDRILSEQRQVRCVRVPRAGVPGRGGERPDARAVRARGNRPAFRVGSASVAGIPARAGRRGAWSEGSPQPGPDRLPP
jgi:hypothetical protein